MVSGTFFQSEYTGYFLDRLLHRFIFLPAKAIIVSFLLYRTGAVVSL